MNISIGNYSFDGSHVETSKLLSESGVYAILGRNGVNATWTVLDIGESGDIKGRVEAHDRQDQWEKCGHADRAFAAYYCDEVARKRVEQELRKQYNPPCGDR